MTRLVTFADGNSVTLHVHSHGLLGAIQPVELVDQLLHDFEFWLLALWSRASDAVEH